MQPNVNMTISVFSTAGSYAIPGCAQALFLPVALPAVQSKTAVMYGVILPLTQSIRGWEREALFSLENGMRFVCEIPEFHKVLCKEDLPCMNESQVRNHVKKLGVRKSMGSGGIPHEC